LDFIDDCPKERAFKLSLENEEFWGIFSKALPGLLTQTGFDYSALKTVFDIYELPVWTRIYWFEKAVCILGVIQEIRKEKQHG
jgi:hypothetical protein